MIEKICYFDDGHFELEKDKVFSRNWIFACLLQEVASNNDFATLDIAEMPIVIQNFKGEVKAFLNVCTHRFNKIQIENFGRRALTCGYHCWSFDKNGFPFFIPKKDKFQELQNDAILHESFCLKEYKTEICGNFVFVSLLDENPIDLKTHLGSHYDILLNISSHIGDRTHYGAINHKANWKILVENVLECYHCSTVHKESLYGKLGIGTKAIDEIQYCESHSSCHFPKIQKRTDEKKRKALKFLDDRPFQHDSFYHIYIFPNLVISSTEGASFYVGQLSPLGPKETSLKVRFLEPRLDYSNVSPAIREILAEESVKLGYEILEEDRAILENIQLGIERTNSPGSINEEEIRIKFFFEKYLNVIKN